MNELAENKVQDIRQQKKILQFEILTYWQSICLRIYYFAIVLEVFVSHYYGSTPLPAWLDITGWTLASIGGYPFIIISCVLLIKSSEIRAYLRMQQIKDRFYDFTLVFFIISMCLFIGESMVSFTIQIVLLVIMAIASEWNELVNRNTLSKLKKAIF